ncbi:hypothetical protein ACOT81_25750 [Streptomyces sp. WI04-05B]|uniref:hypothetical protein n=1 Tax=Streptomyces TaxID=1883 RepID=UPI0029A143AD|nr:MULTISPECIES: hypothetical protein [unclassified Streptomyces]MDX2544900.1 hypothetical protein [Streptomyces sp. WI04-05B]MDX2588948.1 hypothetical protein [Streptomyces sp. WI04-05A]MDX3750800.1 hypothetical protein [Streptomyces sp. AK08-02]
MRIRATVAATTAAALSAALAVTALAAPAVADGQDDAPTRVMDITVNRNHDSLVVVEAARQTKFLISATFDDPSGIRSVAFELEHRTNAGDVDGRIAQIGSGHCVKVDATTSKCESVMIADPYTNLYSNSVAGPWGINFVAVDGHGDVTRGEYLPLARIKRQTRLSQADATPEPVKKGKDVTVKARMTVANWEQHKDVPLVGHQVLLQFRKGTTGAFTTLKKVKTDRNGWAQATVKATVDGQYRYDFAGTSLTPARSGAADYVDVK